MWITLSSPAAVVVLRIVVPAVVVPADFAVLLPLLVGAVL
jgi:hypothetical protein